EKDNDATTVTLLAKGDYDGWMAQQAAPVQACEKRIRVLCDGRQSRRRAGRRLDENPPYRVRMQRRCGNPESNVFYVFSLDRDGLILSVTPNTRVAAYQCFQRSAAPTARAARWAQQPSAWRRTRGRRSRCAPSSTASRRENTSWRPQR
ncbi:unnamed protein product, partial [Phaeothamnion confervicola]